MKYYTMLVARDALRAYLKRIEALFGDESHDLIDEVKAALEDVEEELKAQS